MSKIQPQQSAQGVPEPTDAQIAAAAGRLGGFSDSRPLGQQWDGVYELVRRVVGERAAAHPQQSGAAQPAEQVAPEPIYQYRLNNGSWVDQARNSYEYNRANGVTGLRVVYETIPPAQPEQERKPLSEDEIAEAWPFHLDAESFVQGVRFAERHHGITKESP